MCMELRVENLMKTIFQLRGGSTLVPACMNPNATLWGPTLAGSLVGKLPKGCIQCIKSPHHLTDIQMEIW